jgi:drug/metabolite transporter (DMT)-like permease
MAANTAPSRRSRSGMSGGLVAVILWGLAPVATRAVVSQLSVLPLLVFRLGVAGILLLPWALPVFRRLRLRTAGRLLAAGFLGLTGYTLPVTAGLRWLPAATAGPLLATEPVWVMVLSVAFLGQRFRARAWIGCAVAMGGVVTLADPAAVASAHGDRLIAGTGLVLAGTLAFAAYTIVLRPLSETYGAVPATAASTVAGALPYLALAGTVSLPRLAGLTAAAGGELAFLAAGSSVLGMLLWNRAVLAAGSARVSVLLYLEPVVSVAAAMMLLGEQLTAATIAGGLLILAGVIAAGAPRRRSRGQRGPAPPAAGSAGRPGSGLTGLSADSDRRGIQS